MKQVGEQAKYTLSVVTPRFRKPRSKGAWRNGVWIKSSGKGSRLKNDLKKSPSSNKPQKQSAVLTGYFKKPRIARKSRFKSHENPLKTYERKYSPEEIRLFAEGCRQKRLAQRTEAEISLQQILRELAISFEAEEIIYIRDTADRIVSFRIADFYCREIRLIIEADGGVHAGTKKYDDGSDRYFASQGIRTIRFTNKQIEKTPETVAQLIRKFIYG